MPVRPDEKVASVGFYDLLCNTHAHDVGPVRKLPGLCRRLLPFLLADKLAAYGVYGPGHRLRDTGAVVPDLYDGGLFGPVGQDHDTAASGVMAYGVSDQVVKDPAQEMMVSLQQQALKFRQDQKIQVEPVQQVLFLPFRLPALRIQAAGIQHPCHGLPQKLPGSAP